MLKTLLLIIFIVTAHFGFAQDGAWNPVGANTAYPRTMLKSTEIENVRNTLSEIAIISLFNGVSNNAFSSIPSDNINSSGRRSRAGMAKNAGFVLLMDRRVSNSIVISLTAQERATLQAKTITLLEQINTGVQTLENFTEWQWRSKELIDYAIAFDMLKGAGVPDNLLENSRARLQLFAGNLYYEATRDNFGYSLFNNIKNNHALMTAAALGIAAVVLNDAVSTAEVQQPQKWIDAAMWNIDNVLWKDSKRQSEPGEIAGYAESPYYFRYAFINCLPFIRAMGNFLDDNSLTYSYNNISRSIMNPFYDPNYDNLYEWMRIIRMPDGRMPALDHSFIDMAMPELALTGKSKYNWPLNFENLGNNQNNTLDKQLTTVVDLRSNYIAANTPPELFDDNTFFRALPLSGNIIFRSSWDSDATYMHLHAESGRALSESEGHNQADETSFIIHSDGQLLALDPGYLSWGNRHILRNANNHNMILVNGTGPDFGVPGSSNGAEVLITDAFSHDNLSFSKLTTTYGGADISRSVLFIRNKYFVMMDALASSSSNNYQWRLHGYGLENGTTTTGIYTDNIQKQKGYYTKNGVTLLAHVTAENGINSFEKEVNQHEYGYNVTEDHTTMLINKNGVQNTSFLSLLFPFTTENLNSALVSNPSAAAIKIQDQNYNDFAFSRSSTNLLTFTDVETGLQNGIETDASTLFFSENKVGQLAQYYITNGRRLKYGDKILMNSDEKLDLYLEMKEHGLFTLKNSAAANVILSFDYEVSTLNGDHIEDWDYDNQNNVLSINFSAPGSGEVSFNPTPTPVEMISFNAILKGSNIFLSWTTASEVNNDFFDIERSMNGINWEKIGTVKGNGTSTVPNDYNYTDAKITRRNYTLYYRLKQVDYNGTFEYSDIKSVSLSSDKKLKTFRMYPNPASDFVTVSVDEFNSKGIIINMNGNGQILRQVDLSGKTKIQIDIGKLPKGIYYCRFLNETLIPATEKLIIYGN